MKLPAFALLFALHLSAVEATLNHRHVLQRRQSGSISAAQPSPPAAPPPSPSSSSNAGANSPTPTPLPPPQFPTSYSSSTTSRTITSQVSASSTTPTGPPPLDTGTGIPPLANITMGMATKAPPSFTNSWKPGATPPVQGAPNLPAAFVQTGNWPARDRVPPTDSSEVKEWLKELNGQNIPDLAPTTDGTCANNSAAAADATNRGWWTCGGPTRSTDIVACPDRYTWGVSFDDGPSFYTPILLDYLKEKQLPSTFFVVGSRVYEHPGILIDEYMSGHEISVHTWSHRPLTSLTNEQIVAELGWTRKVIKTVLGITPLTMRPPYGDIDDRVRAISLAMGMIPILWTTSPTGHKFDTNDWRVAGGSINGTTSLDTFQTILKDASTLDTGFIVLQHDLFEITVDLAVGYTLDAALSHDPRFTLKAVGQCMKLPTTNLYMESNKNSTFPNHANGGIDVSGSGKIDTKSGDGGTTAQTVNSNSAAVTNPLPLMSVLTLVCLIMTGLLL